ncbi:NAD(P)-binding protein [Saccharata proteae CBS 121410]|uniref:NAD(P)-binding protein n=1 Tax=Saccharata proteae CBS 121410 TaxID=1314787 RepID=A0A9P4HP39_9PEZI|nr:NAD(P)-binding protein [Saccharata proteae CBS 121410]
MSSTPTTTQQWVLANRPSATPILEGSNATFVLKTAELPALKENQVLVRLRYVSNDPAQRGWISPMQPERLYFPPVEINAPMSTGGVAEIVASTASTHPVGALVSSFALKWSEYLVLDASAVDILPTIPGISATHFIGALGAPGLTGFYGIRDVAEAKASDIVVVSGAAGATGSMVVQIAKKMIGCKKVIGIAGSESKCEWVKSLGADECLNYKSPTFAEDLKRATPDYVDVYYDNVGGEMLDLMLGRMQRFGRVALCGAIATYNSDQPTVLKNWFEVISMRIQLKGLIVLDCFHKAKEMVGELVQAFQEGKIRIGDEGETVVETGFEGVPATWMKLFEGANTGKLVTKLY